MFKTMRRADRQLSQEEAEAILREGAAGTLSLAGNTYPYGVPMNYIVRENEIWMHGARADGDKDHRLGQDSRACFSVFTHIEGAKFKSAVAFGRIDAIDDDDAVAGLLEEVVEKYIPEAAWEHAKANIPARAPLTRAYRLTIEHLSGKVVDRP